LILNLARKLSFGVTVTFLTISAITFIVEPKWSYEHIFVELECGLMTVWFTWSGDWGFWEPRGYTATLPSRYHYFVAPDFDGYFLYVPYWLVLSVSTPIWLTLRRKHQIPLRWKAEGKCVGCGYDLTGNTTGVCPECNAKAVA